MRGNGNSRGTGRGQRRKLAGYTQKELARECALDVKTIRAWERGFPVKPSSESTIETNLKPRQTK